MIDTFLRSAWNSFKRFRSGVFGMSVKALDLAAARRYEARYTAFFWCNMEVTRFIWANVSAAGMPRLAQVLSRTVPRRFTAKVYSRRASLTAQKTHLTYTRTDPWDNLLASNDCECLHQLSSLVRNTTDRSDVELLVFKFNGQPCWQDSSHPDILPPFERFPGHRSRGKDSKVGRSTLHVKGKVSRDAKDDLVGQPRKKSIPAPMNT